jgi:hypothetical protein
MTPTRILPDLQCSLLCEEIRQEINGNFFLLGIIDVVRVPHLPITASRLSLFNRWTSGVGAFTESVRLLAPDQTTVLSKIEVKFQMKNTNITATTFSQFVNVEFKTTGPYFIEVLVDDIMKVRYPINIILVPQPGPAQGGAPPPSPPPAP